MFQAIRSFKHAVCRSLDRPGLLPGQPSRAKVRRSQESKAADQGVPVIISTHHKTGTVWMLKIFQLLTQPELNYEFINLTKSGPERKLPDLVPVYFDPRGEYTKTTGLEKDFVGLHVIRDPRDVVISGAYYHQKSPEAWLHVQQEKFGGRTYQEAIKASPEEDRFMFEMENMGGATIRDMLDWDYGDPRFVNLKYEDLMSDVDLTGFAEIFSFLGFGKKTTRSLIERTKVVSLHTQGKMARTEHVRSGAAAQWKSEFRRRDGERFLELFGPALITLGYEKDDSWLDLLAP
ncbi:sulfotransferase domain-containing protein [Methyloligella solikamskensis]|uniref:Sulfotransferase domain-containing protein n=1 Tax=Methyloligella solikamskensis TaxID=1177756 RepID=A0ABW3JAY7_9HYPH